mgnify:CR=1 FL=1
MINQKQEKKNNIEVLTFGCRLNSYESEVIKNNNSVNKRTVIFNTCAVTKEAERQARQAVRKHKKQEPDTRVVVTGCSAQINPRYWADMPEVSAVVGNSEKLKKNIFREDQPSFQVNDIMQVQEASSHMLHAFNERARAFIEIQNGCNHRCSFCIIPYARGNSRSIEPLELIRNIKILVSEGFQEIVLTGVDIGDYGKDFKNKIKFTDIVKKILEEVPDLCRLRLSSIDPKEIDLDLVRLISSEHRIMPYIHLSAQSGDDNILRKMRRRHRRRDIIEICNELKKARNDIVFGADLIAGFPEEDKKMFENTINLIDDCDLTFLHVFPYSEREGTAAANYIQLPVSERKKRARLLRKYGFFARERKFNSFIGKRVEVLIESNNTGYTQHFIPIKFDDELRVGSIKNLQVVSSSQFNLNGVLI